MAPNDEIRIEEAELLAHVGVPEAERARAQRIVISLTLHSRTRFSELDDDLNRAVDYAGVCAELQRFVAGRRDKLIETLAHETAEHLLRTFDLRRVELELRKFALPQTRHVAVRVVREEPNAP